LLYDGREFFCRRFATGRIASTRQMPTARSIRAPVAPFRVLVLADPRGDLQAAYREGMEIASFLDARRDLFHVDFKSHPVDIAFVKKHLRDYDIVHYAGHTKYDAQNPSESGWLLSDGTLTAANYDVLHFAAHAELNKDDPLSSTVFLAKGGQEDGRLEVREILIWISMPAW
jgi:CHAT domain-containing protein